MPIVQSIADASARGYGHLNNAAPSVIASGLVLNLDATQYSSYPGSGTTWYDLSPSGLHATGGSAISGQALQSNQAYNTSSTSILNTDTHSLFMSLQINNTSGNWDKIFGYQAGGSDRSPGIWRYPSSRKIHWRFDPGNTDADFSATASTGYETSGTEFTPNTWYYVGVTKNGGTASVYVNGVKLADRGVANPKTSGNAAINLFPGYNGSASMRHVHVYNRVISADEALANYNAVKNKLV